MDALQKRYAPALRKALSFPKTIVASAIVLFAISAFVMTTLGGEFIPQLEEGDFAVETRILSGSNLNTTMESVKKAAGILKERFPEVEKVVTKIGSGEVPTEPLPMDVGDMIISLKDKSEWTSAKTFPELAEKMAEAVKEVPGVTTSFQFPVQMRFNELMTGARQDVVCKIYGDDLDSLTTYAGQLGQIINTVDGAKDLYVETVTGVSQTVVEIKRNVLPNYGLTVEDVNRTLNMAFAGQTAGYVYEGEKRFDLTVRMDKDLRKQTENVNSLLVALPNGGEIPLSEVADVQVKSGPYQIQRDNAKRRIIIGFNVRGRDVQSVVEELKAKVGQDMQIPTDYTIQYGGQFENLRAAKARLGIAVPVALLMILVLLYFAFRSLKHGLLIFSAIPLSAIGGVLALVIVGMPFSISAGVGFIALFGVAVLNGIVLIAEFNRLKKEGMQNLTEIVMKGTQVRLRPVLMTAAVASLGFLPMALSHGAGAEVQRPLATVVIGGLVTSTLLTLLVLPVLYVMVEGFTFRKKNITKPVMVFMICVMPVLSQAQNTVSLQNVLDSALQNNLAIQIEKDMAFGKQAMSHTGWDLPKTDINLQYGQYNSTALDYNIGISQSIQFPTVYVAQTAWLKSEVKTALLSVENRKNEIRRRVRQVYYEWQILYQREILLKYADSLYTVFAQKAEQRSMMGETGLLESNSAKNQSVQIRQQLSSVKTEKNNLVMLLRQLMNTSAEIIPEITDVEIKAAISTNGVFPLVAFRTQALNSVTTVRKLEKAKLLPDLLIGYNNTGLSGIQNVNGADVYFGANKRFSYLSAGIGIPLFFGAQASRIKASKIAVMQSRKELSAAEQDWKTSLYNTQNTIQNLRNVLQEYKTIVLPNAQQNLQLADQQLGGGSIGYLEWMILVNQSIQSQNEYLNQVRLYDMAVIENLYLNGN
jgi:cobalt-zinc-cadmium resistance protein CzcA